MAIALPLLVAAGLGVLGTNRLLRGPQGYNPDGVLTMKLLLPDRTYPDDAAQRRFIDRALEAVAAVPGVQHATVANSLPASGSNSSSAIELDGRPAPDPPEFADGRQRLVGSPFRDDGNTAEARTRIHGLGSGRHRLRRGRSESMAAKYGRARTHRPPAQDSLRPAARPYRPWSPSSAVGRHLQDWFNRPERADDVRPIAQARRTTSAVARARGGIRWRSPAGSGSAASHRRAQPVYEMASMRQVLHDRMIGLQYLSAIMTVFGTLALFLAAVGLYAVISYLVAQRRHEIGLRIALGATRRDVMRLTVGQALRLTLLGGGIGLALSIG